MHTARAGESYYDNLLISARECRYNAVLDARSKIFSKVRRLLESICETKAYTEPPYVNKLNDLNVAQTGNNFASRRPASMRIQSLYFLVFDFGNR